MLCTQIGFLFWHSEQFMFTTCSEFVVFMQWTGKLMNNLLSYYRLIDTRIWASDKDLPVTLNLIEEKHFVKYDSVQYSVELR